MNITQMTLDALRTLITAAKEHADKIPANIHDTYTLWQTVSTREFYNELNFLDQLLTYPLEQIPAIFKARCQARQTTPEQFISYADHPNTRTNRLYVQLALLIFNPLDLQSLLAILMPASTRYFHFDATQSTLKISEMTALAGVPITPHALENCVFFEDAVFPLELTPHAFQTHLTRYRALSAYPVLREKCYTHNDDYRTLATHLRQMNNEVDTPKDRLRLLINELNAGKTSVTGMEYANISVTLTIDEFFQYYLALPTTIQKVLNKLPSGIERPATLGELLTIMQDPKTTFDTCIEIGAINLDRALTLNSKHDALNYRPEITQAALDTLDAHYETLTFSPQRGTDTLIVFPHALLANAFEKIMLDNAEVFLLLLKDLSPAAYSSLLQFMQLPPSRENTQHLFDTLIDYCREGLLNEEQKAGLLNALLELTTDKYRDIILDGLKLVLFNSLPKNARLAMLAKPLTKEKYAEYSTLLNLSIFAYAESRNDLLPLLSPVLRFEIGLENRQLNQVDLNETVLRAFVFDPEADPTQENSLIVRILTNPNKALGLAAFEELLATLIRMQIIGRNFKDAEDKNLLHYVCEYDSLDNRFLRILSQSTVLRGLNFQRDKHGLIPSDKVAYIDSFLTILNEHFPRERMTALTGEPLHVRTLHVLETDVNTQGLYYFKILDTLHEDDQIAFLKYLTPSGQRVIDALIQSMPAIRVIYGNYMRDEYQPFEWLLYLFTDTRLTHTDELINIALSMPYWAETKNTLKTVFQNEFVNPHFSVNTTANRGLLLGFFDDYNLILTKPDCYNAIVDAANHAPSLENIEYIEALLMQYCESWTDTLDAPASEELLTLLRIALKQSSIPSNNGGMVFNPSLLLFFHAKMRGPHYETSFSNLTVTLGAPINRTLTISELIDDVLLYLTTDLQTSPGLVCDLYVGLLYNTDRPQILTFLESHLIAAANQPEAVSANIRNALSLLTNAHNTLSFYTIEKTLKFYFDILRVAQQEKANSIALQNKIKTALTHTRPTERLILLNIRPHGATRTLNEQFGSLIKPIMSEMYQRYQHTQSSIAALEEYLQFAEYDWVKLLKVIFYRGDVSSLEHLLTSRLADMQRLHQKHNLISLYFSSCEKYSRLMLYRLHSFGFSLADPANQISTDKLTDCLRAITKTAYHNDATNTGDLVLTKTSALIDALVSAGADINGADADTMPPLFHAQNTHVMEKLLSHGANINFVTASGETILSRLLKKIITEGGSIDTRMILSLLKNGLSPTILNQYVMINDSYVTILSVLLDSCHSNGSFLRLMEYKACIAALISAGANPVFWHSTKFAYAKLIKILPAHSALLSHAPAYEAVVGETAMILKMKHCIDVAKKAYSKSSSTVRQSTTKEKFIDYDNTTKLNHLTRVSCLFNCAPSINLIHTELKALINTFIDSNEHGIITVARQPDLSTHTFLFDLIRSIYGEAQVPTVPPPARGEKPLKRYFAGKVPEHLFVKKELAEFFAELHPDQFSTFNVLSVLSLFRTKYDGRLHLDDLSAEQISALFDQLFLDSKSYSPKEKLVHPILDLNNAVHLANFYTRLYQSLPTMSRLHFNDILRTIPAAHYPFFFEAMPVETRFELVSWCDLKLFNELEGHTPRTQACMFAFVGKNAYEQLIRYQHISDSAVQRPTQATAETFAEWEERVQAFSNTMVKNDRGDTVFHDAIRCDPLLNKLRVLFSQVPSTFDRVILLFMKDKTGTSLLNYLQNRPGAEITNDLIFLFQGGHSPSVSLHHPFIREICLQVPALFFAILQINYANPAQLRKVACLHARHRGVLLLDLALQLLYPNHIQSITFGSFPPIYSDYFLLRGKLLTEQPALAAGLSLFSSDQTRAAVIHERLNKLASYTDESLFEHLNNGDGMRQNTYQI